MPLFIQEVIPYTPTNPGIPVPFDEPISPAKLWQWASELYGAAGHR
jgi:hypothetical protein